MIILLLDVLIAYLLDLIIGDPYSLPHPVRFIGWMIKTAERLLRKQPAVVPHCKTGQNQEVNGASGTLCSKNNADGSAGSPDNSASAAKRERIAGTVLTIVVVSTTFLIVFGILLLFRAIHPMLFHAGNIYFIYTSLAGKCLADEARKVYALLKAGDLPAARRQLSMLVGRQTENLSEQEITRGVIETTAENTVDGVLSPMLYAVLGSFFGIGAPLAYAFKAISTLDSMVGYMNERYINFGRTSAKADDAANYIPARLSGLIIPLAAFFCRLNAGKSFYIMKRDRHNHKSPNCAYPEAAFAGALGIRIGGTNIYFGQAVVKPTIGDTDKEISIGGIPEAIRLMHAASLLTLVISLTAAFAIYLALHGTN